MPNAMAAEKLIYVKTAAQMLCCTERHVYNMIQEGRLEAVRVGPRGMRVKKSSVDQYIRDNTVEPEDFFM